MSDINSETPAPLASVESPKPKFSILRLGCLCSLLFYVLLLFSGAFGAQLIPEPIATLVFGSIGFVARYFRHPAARILWDEIAIAAICWLLATVGFHQMVRWFLTSRTSQLLRLWLVKDSLRVSLLLLLGATASIAMLSGLHQLFWYVSSPAAKHYVEFNERQAPRENLHQFGRTLEALQQNEGANDGQSWAACLLPYLGSEHRGHAALNAFDPNLDWNEGSNAELARRVVPAFINPQCDNRTTSDGFGVAHFAGNVHAFRADANSQLIHDRREDRVPSLLIGEAVL